ncbi:hypothetical protein GUITHDRAFT_109974 [Guillardia theta CCMP2712]|uniref:C3H1-type domain-containing protein n=1 Tax=Guillardia theta (strain CCMP2712) TaxID=905079 RepID=L1J7W2_GUITC|nr:hypothetical protein GUITHDRAFT_109974 [Guillardia theta CCMP2712]EKX44189.1 hypothetical protein GUITHDRAFT_109974 [Guillardia theta CCMP2712]|eukprot:XP_005831169.1 hypothetical protein GUITHDRAFT_109974 [Guillardia theta CCMP2712]
MHKKTSKVDITDCASKFGSVLSVRIWYGFGTAIVEMGAAVEARAMVEANRRDPVVIRGKNVEMNFGFPASEEQKFKEDPRNPAYVEKEVRRLLHFLVDRVEQKELKHASHLLRERHNGLKRSMDEQLSRSGKLFSDMCWDWVVSGGFCSRGEFCSFRHEMVPFCEVPSRYRWLTRKDTFSSSRESAIHKTAVNEILVRLSRTVQNKKMLILDGASCNSVRALSSSDQRSCKEEIFVPNNCTETYLKICGSNLCTVFHGSVRAFVDSVPSLRFGLVYLDYCCTLAAGRRRVEKSPIADLFTMFSYGQFDPSGCILCVCLADPEDRDKKSSRSAQKSRHLTKQQKEQQTSASSSGSSDDSSDDDRSSDQDWGQAQGTLHWSAERVALWRDGRACHEASGEIRELKVHGLVSN